MRPYDSEMRKILQRIKEWRTYHDQTFQVTPYSFFLLIRSRILSQSHFSYSIAVYFGPVTVFLYYCCDFLKHPWCVMYGRGAFQNLPFNFWRIENSQGINRTGKSAESTRTDLEMSSMLPAHTDPYNRGPVQIQQLKRAGGKVVAEKRPILASWIVWCILCGFLKGTLYTKNQQKVLPFSIVHRPYSVWTVPQHL